jgi:hypothetical protein
MPNDKAGYHYYICLQADIIKGLSVTEKGHKNLPSSFVTNWHCFQK